MADRHNSPLDILLAVLKEATPANAKAQIPGDLRLSSIAAAAGTDARTASAQQPAMFVPTLALSRHRELLTRFIASTGVDLASHHEAAALLTQLHALADDISAHLEDAHLELASACEGMDLFVHLTGLAHREALNASNVRSLLAPLHQQVERAASAVGNLL